MMIPREELEVTRRKKTKAVVGDQEGLLIEEAGDRAGCVSHQLVTSAGAERKEECGWRS